jgi:hypothetical protein
VQKSDLLNNTRKDRMPPLMVDEVLLLVDTYFQLKKVSSPTDRKELIVELSKAMRQLPFYPEFQDNPEFRSIAGMQMCIANVGYCDPENSSKFGHGSKLQKRVFDEYIEKQDVLHSISKAIIRISREQFYIDYSYSDCIFGMLLPSYHCYLERTNKVVYTVKKTLEFQRKDCSVCGSEVNKLFPGFDLMEIHIDVPLCDCVKPDVISPSTISFVCPTCHKAAHSKIEFFRISELKKKMGRTCDV